MEHQQQRQQQRRPPRPALERSANTADVPPRLARSSRLDSLAAIANLAAVAQPASAPPSTANSVDTSPSSLSVSLPPSPGAFSSVGLRTASPTPPSSVALSGQASPVLSAPQLGSTVLTSPSIGSLAPGAGAGAGKPPSVQSSSSSTRTNTGFVVTSRPKPYAPPPDSPGPPYFMAKSPFYRSTPPGSRQNSRDNSREASPAPSARNSLERDRERSGLGRGPAPHGTSPFPPPVPSTSAAPAMGLAAAATLALAPSLAPSLAPLRRGSSPAALPTAGGLARGGYASGAEAAEPKTTRTLSSSIDSKGRRMVNQYVRLKTIGQGSHGKVWLCAEPSSLEDEGEGEEEGEKGDEEDPTACEDGRAARRRRRTPSERWEADIDAGRVRYCAIKSVARDGPGGAKGHRSLRLAAHQKGRKQSSQGSGGIGADDKVKREVAIMKRLDHPNIVRLKEVIDDAKSRKVFMVLEFMAGGQVVWQDDNKQPTMTVDDARRTFRDVVLGLEYLHYQGIIHRDIKPANLLWTEDHATVKISDFGVSHVSEALMRCAGDDDGVCQGEDDKALRKTAGSPAFFAPELCFPAEFTPTPNAHGGSSTALDRGEGVGLASIRGDGESETYFPRGADGARLTPTSSGAVYSPPTSPNGLPLSEKIISRPLPPPSPTAPRTRPPVGKGIDVWALGVTLYCLLFGDTPFTARTEYELYNVIAREGIRVPEKMGREGAWTGVGQGWSGCGTGEEGREVVDLLGRLLEKDPLKRITLDEVKKHPWVLRNLSNPDSWLRATDLAQTTHVTITEDDVEHATQERSAAGDALLPPIRSRPGIKRALNAALARFPAFARIKSTRTAASTGEEDAALAAGEQESRSRSKSNSSAGHSGGDATTGGAGTGTGTSTLVSEGTTVSGGVSRQPSDAGGAPFERRGWSRDGGFGMDLRRIISGGGGGAESSGTNSPSHRGGWGGRAFRKTTSMEPPPSFPELARSVSSSSVLGSSAPASRSHLSHHLFTRKPSDSSDTVAARSSQASSVVASPSPGTTRSGFSPSPWAGSDTESTGHAASKGSNSNSGSGRTLSRMLSRLHSHSGAGSTTTSANASIRSRSGARQFSGSTDGGSEDPHVTSPQHRTVSAVSLSSGISPAVIEQLEAKGTTRDQFDALGRLVVGRKDSGKSSMGRSSIRAGVTEAGMDLADDDDDGPIDLTEFEYTDSDEDDDDDELDDFMQPPLAQGNHLSGWNYPGFADFKMGVHSPSNEHVAHAPDARPSAYLSPTHTPPTDELDPFEEEDGKVGPTSTPSAAAASRPTRQPTPPYVPYADAVSFSLCPLDFDFDNLGLYSSAARRDSSEQEQTPRSTAPSFSLAHGVPPNTPALAGTTGLQIPPPPVHADSFGSDNGRSRSPRDGSIRGVSLDPPSPRKASVALDAWDDDEDADGDEEEILVVPRRRRAATLSGNGTPTSSR
ncbi:hypothetical protein JCM10450v2_002503 [Rhodotorula kratochvilovae]